ncbi:MAG: hypothetical protein ACRDOI_46865 [Trebonia sp.]
MTRWATWRHSRRSCGWPKARDALPAAVERLLAADAAAEIAAAFSDQAVYPERIVVDGPASARPGLGRRFPGWPGPVLVLSVENRGVCSWGVPLDGDDDCPVLVGGELLDAGEATVEYAASVEDFIAARRWDRRCLDSGPVLQAQAPELTRSGLGYLRARLSRRSRRRAGPDPGSTGSRAGACRSCCGHRTVSRRSAADPYRPPGLGDLGWALRSRSVRW